MRAVSHDDVARALDELCHSDVVVAGGILLEYGLRQVPRKPREATADELPDATTPPA